MNLLKQLFHVAVKNRITLSRYTPHNRRLRMLDRSSMRHRAGTKFAKAAKKHRADHSNPGGVVSAYFRAKNSKVA